MPKRLKAVRTNLPQKTEPIRTGKNGSDEKPVDEGPKINFTGTVTVPIGNTGWGATANGTLSVGSSGSTTMEGSFSPVQGAASGVGFGVSASGPIGNNGGSWKAGGNVNFPNFRGPVGVTGFVGAYFPF